MNTDTVKCLIRNLSEYAYTFFIYSYDNSGNRSVVTEIDNARSYGPIYQSTLHNRLPDSNTPFQVNADGSVILTFLKPDTVNITTKLNYTDSTGKSGTAYISPDSSTVRLPSYKLGAPVLYQSSYTPVKGAIDTFLTLKADTFPQIFRLAQCAKSLFSEMKLPGDIGVYQTSTSVSKLWDGSVGPQGYPNIFHSDGSQNMPQAFSFDMGIIYPNLAVMEETGRNCCHNPDDFEVWGIADTTGAKQSLPTQDPAWKADAIAKGWTLLTEAHRSDDGSPAMKFNLITNPPPVRFIRIRVIHVTSGSTNSSNLSELTFWNKQ
jgi:hypothetical protein